MTEQEMLEVVRYLAQKQDELIARNHDLIAANTKLFVTGAAISEALLLLEQAHTAAHQGNLPGCMAYVAQAMEILANDDPGPPEASG